MGSACTAAAKLVKTSAASIPGQSGPAHEARIAAHCHHRQHPLRLARCQLHCQLPTQRPAHVYRPLRRSRQNARPAGLPARGSSPTGKARGTARQVQQGNIRPGPQRTPAAVARLRDCSPSRAAAPAPAAPPCVAGRYSGSSRISAPPRQQTANCSNSRSTCSSLCAALRVMRRREVPAGTVGGRIAPINRPRSRSRSLRASARAGVSHQQRLDGAGGRHQRQIQLRGAAAKAAVSDRPGAAGARTPPAPDAGTPRLAAATAGGSAVV